MGYNRVKTHHRRDLAFKEFGELAKHYRPSVLAYKPSFRPFDLQKLPRHKILTVKAFLPLAVARRARQKIYTYPHPLQAQMQGRVLRTPLITKKTKFVPVKVRIRVPERLPAVRGSYVTISHGRINVHSRKQLQAVLARQELNRRRYVETKTNRRHARHGQLDSPGAAAFGAVAYGNQMGFSVGALADQALVARAVLKGGF